ncbi:MAG TPA: hypothetical protein VIY48_04135 [Candidatus Paceibacterota bacterium]
MAWTTPTVWAVGQEAVAADFNLYISDNLTYLHGDAGVIALTNIVNATGFQVSGVALAASHLSNGVTGSGAVVLATSPTISGISLTGTPTAPTAAVDTNTTQIATTAFVIGQGYAKLASPALTGTPTAPTAAVDTNTTQIATTAFVVGQGYAKLASPTFTGTPAAPTPTAGDNSTKIATTAFTVTAFSTASGIKAKNTTPVSTSSAALTTLQSISTGSLGVIGGENGAVFTLFAVFNVTGTAGGKEVDIYCTTNGTNTPWISGGIPAGTTGAVIIKFVFAMRYDSISNTFLGCGQGFIAANGQQFITEIAANNLTWNNQSGTNPTSWDGITKGNCNNAADSVTSQLFMIRVT